MTDIDPASIRHALLIGRRIDRISELWLASVVSDFIAARDPEPRLARAVQRERDCLIRFYCERYHPGLSRHKQACAMLADLERHRRAQTRSDDAKAQTLDMLLGFDVPRLRRLQDIL